MEDDSVAPVVLEEPEDHHESFAEAEDTLYDDLPADEMRGGEPEEEEMDPDQEVPAEMSADDERSVFVGSVEYECTVENLRDHFSSCGQISRVTIMVNRKTGQPLGYGYVQFKSKESVVNALLLDSTELYGRQLKVQTKRKNIPGMGRFSGPKRGGLGMMPGGLDQKAMGSVNPVLLAQMMSYMMQTSQRGFKSRGGIRGARGSFRGQDIRGGRGSRGGWNADVRGGKGQSKRTKRGG